MKFIICDLCKYICKDKDCDCHKTGICCECGEFKAEELAEAYSLDFEEIHTND